MIKIENYSKVYKDKTVLNNINLELKEGKIYGFIGKNASGKTMLFKAICGFIIATKGKIFINNKEIGRDIDFPEKCGVIIETPGFINNISGFKNLKILASINDSINDDKIKESMELVGLNPNEKISVKKYSLGMRQKLAIAQAIMEEPELLILDEPMNSLDSDSVENIRNILLDIKSKGTTILISSHNIDDINILSDEIYKVENGVVSKLDS
ncbi:ATP-binding cassette domain-containing protein [Clostridium perfringens]|uniref:ATP-binding cassette domain-containing protein n=1 Tax=Clostridium tertium TaxID=1559 RepID=A0A9X3XPQ9_9CLOT|nr:MULTISPECIES: ATP-binding cassette domain-containing protein [Clostridium]AQW24500.1 multidrug ABC transporter ATP-binding protein [Clostridium perfringens]EHK2305757.1 ATP-binding cassette domain-containing protein [Clostridium perfringens]EHK2336711.1 ATP-binding cassette domain-containing protein [Clostridium perfringens]EHK2349517.1 ATP-binding cassette domain-containing protein [Clostridium perfringens]EIF5082541.1 ATP-binding cassette domain-containing protein [Clostridium perfringens